MSFVLNLITQGWHVYIVLQHFRRNVKKYIFERSRPAKIQIRWHIRGNWSESSLGAFWIAKAAKFLHAYKKDTYQFVRIRRLVWVLVGRSHQKENCLTLRLSWYQKTPETGPEVMKLFSCSTQLSMKFVLLLNFKLLTIAIFFAKHSWAWNFLC